MSATVEEGRLATPQGAQLAWRRVRGRGPTVVWLGGYRSDMTGTKAAIDQLTEGPLVLVGSSMGGWIACLVALAREARVQALVLVAPAPDFTDKLVEPELTAEARETLLRDGVVYTPTDDGPGDPFTQRLLEEGRRWSILPGPIAISAPVRILQGGADAVVPWRHALSLVDAVVSEDVVFTLVKDGDHRLSRPQDLRRLIALVEASV
jgi:alpha-beta hydrolase superfamily lysophospholipase